MIDWYSNKKVAIFFDDKPRICIRYILPNTNKEKKKSIKKYPFINKKLLKVLLKDLRKGKKYNFEIQKNYCFDGASVPRFFWRIIGPNTDNNFLIAALIHDVLCENHHYVDSDRKFSSLVFNALLEASDVNPVKRFFMKNSVDFYQRFCHWGTNKQGANIQGVNTPGVNTKVINTHGVSKKKISGIGLSDRGSKYG